MLSLRLAPLALIALSVLTTPSHAQATQPVKLPPVPILGHWPEPAFGHDVQCHGQYSLGELQEFYTRARLGMWLPSTRSVKLNEANHCIVVTVDDIGTARLMELLLRGVAVPRRAVLLQLTKNPVA